MNRRIATSLSSSAVALALVTACSGPVEISVSLVDPCNQDAVATMDFLRFEPRGTDIDSVGLSTIQAQEDGTTQPIEIPLASMATTGSSTSPSPSGAAIRYHFPMKPNVPGKPSSDSMQTDIPRDAKGRTV